MYSTTSSIGNFILFYHACARTHTSVYFGPILLLHEYTLLDLVLYMYTYMYIDIQRIQYTDSMAPSFVKFCQVYHAFARAHTTVYFGPILLLHEYTLHSYTTKYTLHYVYSNPDLDFLVHHSRYSSSTQYTACSTRCTSIQHVC